MKLYVVTEGSYSDYRIVCIFKNKKKANNYVKYHGEIGFDGMRCEEFELVDDSYQIITSGYYNFVATCDLHKGNKFTTKRVEVRDLGLTGEPKKELTKLLYYDHPTWKLCIYRSVREDVATRSEARLKVKKIIVDIANQINYYRSEGMHFNDIQALIEKGI